MDVLEPVLGILVVGLVLLDVFYTVLFPASGHGPLRRPMSRWTWRLFAAVARRLADPRRRDFLAYSGPTQISLSIISWVVLLVVGWALVYHPALGSGIVASSGPTDTGWDTAIYVSGFTLSTLGTGDVIPVTGGYRILTVVESAVGFSIFTMVLTYFLSIYGAITSRKTFGSSLHHRTYDTGTATQLVVGISKMGEMGGGSEQLTELARFLTHTLETHRSYPVLRYFHFRDERYALPRLLLVSLDTATLLRSALAEQPYSRLLSSPVLFEVHGAALELLGELVPRAREGAAPGSRRSEWQEHFLCSVDVLRRNGLEVTDDLAGAAERYAGLRDGWDDRLRALAGAMVYEWDRVQPDLHAVGGVR